LFSPKVLYLIATKTLTLKERISTPKTAQKHKELGLDYVNNTQMALEARTADGTSKVINGPINELCSALFRPHTKIR
jgi:hypothetical protein